MQTFSLNLKKILSYLSAGFVFVALYACNPGDARKNPPNPELRVKKNLEEGRGFRLNNVIKDRRKGGGNFEFASSNELWRASLDTIDFMPLSSVNYSGGIIVTDWYTDSANLDESVKISIRFLSNEVSVDAIDIKIFYKKCNQVMNCEVTQKKGSLLTELKREILNKAATYKKLKKDKNFEEYTGSAGKVD